MSNPLQVLTGVVGGVVGWFVGGPTGAAYGFQLGLLAGSALFPAQLPSVTGPRLDDLRTTTSQIGAPVVIVYGTIAVPGTFMWLGPVVEHSHTESVGGKAAPEQNQTTFTYTQSVAIGLCEGASDGTNSSTVSAITGILRIWENGVLMYDARPQQDGESDDAYEARLTAAAAYEDTFTLYTGTADQMPDPTIELQEGAGNVPAFRHLAYVVYPDRQLQDNQGRRHPNFKFEVTRTVETTCEEVEFHPITFNAANTSFANDTAALADFFITLEGGGTWTGFNPDETITIKPDSQNAPLAWSPWGHPALIGGNPHTGSIYQFRVLKNLTPGDGETFQAAGGPFDGYAAAVAAFNSQFPDGVTITGASTYTFYLVDGGVSGDNSGGVYLRLTTTRCTTEVNSVSIGSIVRDICARVGLTSVITTDMDFINVDGYAVTRVMPARSAIDPLRSIGFFDPVEVDGAFKLVARGHDPQGLLKTDDMGACLTGSDPPPAVTTRKILDTDLPRSVRVTYVAPSRDYEDGQQSSQPRVNTLAVNDVDVQLVAAISDDQAAQIADILQADAWVSRWTHEIAVDREWLGLVPTDVILAPIEDRIYRLRVVSTNDQDVCIRTLQLCRDLSDYVSLAVAAPVGRVPSIVAAVSATQLLMLDLPALVDTHDDAGFYMAARSTGSGTSWRGCVVYKSVDGGSVYSPAASVTGAATVGTLVGPVPPGATSVFDDVNDIVVDIEDGKTLETRTVDAVLAGANAACIGADGRWEIVQFTTAELISGGTNRWRLTGLLRGRRGTEHNVGTSLTADTFVLLSDGAVARLTLANAEVGAARSYKAVSIGTPPTSAVPFSFTGHGQALAPFSPVDVTADIVAGDVVITWTRRDRLGTMLQSGVALAMSEATESYSVDIIDATVSPPVVKRTLTAATGTVTYTAAEQTADFGGAVTLDQIAIDVYQLSAVVGRGTPGVFP